MLVYEKSLDSNRRLVAFLPSIFKSTHDGGDDEAPVEYEVREPVGRHLAQEDEDDAVGGGGEGLDAVLDGGVALLRGVDERVTLLQKNKEYVFYVLFFKKI